MDLIDRYLGAIRWNLPRDANADDVIAELRDVIASRIEDREESLDRPLTEAEVSAVLHDFGHPLVVAARYGSQQWLIGPDLFPFYWFALKVVTALGATLLAITAGANAVASGHVTLSLLHAAHGAFWTLVGNAGLVTLVFAIIERTGWMADKVQQWKPESLPDLSQVQSKPKSAWEAVFEVAVGVAFILWWVGLIRVPIAYTDVKGLRLTPDPIWTTLWLPILALLVARLVFNLVQWLRPGWTMVRAALAVGTAVGGFALLAILYRADHWLTASSATLPADQIADIDRSTNLGIHTAILVVGAILAFQCGQELWRLYRARG